MKVWIRMNEVKKHNKVLSDWVETYTDNNCCYKIGKMFNDFK